jgi:hypothetical protein
MRRLWNRLVGTQGITEEQQNAVGHVIAVMRTVGEDPRYAEMATEAVRMIEDAFPEATLTPGRS